MYCNVMQWYGMAGAATWQSLHLYHLQTAKYIHCICTNARSFLFNAISHDKTVYDADSNGLNECNALPLRILQSQWEVHW